MTYCSGTDMQAYVLNVPLLVVISKSKLYIHVYIQVQVVTARRHIDTITFAACNSSKFFAVGFACTTVVIMIL